MSSGRFQVVIHPLYNAVCKTCGVDYSHRTLLETGLDSDFCNRPHYIEGADGTCEYGYVHSVDITQQGAVYICEQCAIALAQVVGALAPSVALEIKEENGRLINYIRELEQENLGMKGVIDGYRKLASVNLPHSLERDIILSSVPQTDSESTGSESSGAEDSIRSGTFEDGTFRTELGNPETNEHIDDNGDSTESDNVQSDSERESGKNGNKSDDQSKPQTYDDVLR